MAAGDRIVGFRPEREEKRVAGAALFSIDQIKKKLDAGQKPREDDFMNGPQKRSSAEEVFEGSLLKSKNEHEEKKVKFFSRIFVNAAFDSTISAGEANYLLHLLETLTYRKLLILSLFMRKNEIVGLSLRQEDYTNTSSGTQIDTLSILQETYELYNFGLIACRDQQSKNFSALLGLYDISPNLMELTTLGKRCFEIMGLSEIPLTEIQGVGEKLF